MRPARIIAKSDTYSTELQRRQSYRKATSILGEISLGDRARRIPCKVVDMSATGARLSLRRDDCVSRTGRACLAARLGLFLDKKGTNVECQVVWQNDEHVGVRFCSPIQNVHH